MIQCPLKKNGTLTVKCKLRLHLYFYMCFYAYMNTYKSKYFLFYISFSIDNIDLMDKSSKLIDKAERWYILLLMKALKIKEKDPKLTVIRRPS